MAAALYGPAGFFVRPGAGPAAHFRTSAHASPLFAGAIATLLSRLDAALGHPEVLDVVDIGAGRGELLMALSASVPASLATRLRLFAVELAPAEGGGQERATDTSLARPAGSGPIAWRAEPPPNIRGLLLATEWLDNIPVDCAEVDPGGLPRYVLVDPATGTERLGDPVTGADADWLARWWPLTTPGTRAEIGRTRDEAWAAAVRRVERGAALAVDYGHFADDRPPLGTLTGYLAGREVPPVPDGSRDLTAHVAFDAVTAEAAARERPALVRQAAALRALGVDGSRPPRELADRDPGDYLRRLARAGAAAELTDPTGLGGHHWLLQPVALGQDVTGWLA